MDNLYIDYGTILNSLHFEKEIYFTNYLNEVFGDLSRRTENLMLSSETNTEESNITQHKKNQIYNLMAAPKISKIVFTDYFKIPGFICEKLFISLDKDNDSFLNASEFIGGMIRLYQGTFTETAEIIFNIFDYDKDGYITKGDVKVLLSYLPIKPLIEQNYYKNQMKSLDDIDHIIKDSFGKNDKMNLKTFINVIEDKKSDIYLQLLTFMYNHKPFTENTVNACKIAKKGSFGLPSHAKRTKKILSLNENMSEEQVVNPRFPSPSKKTLLEPTEKFLSNLYVNSNGELLSPQEAERKENILKNENTIDLNYINNNNNKKKSSNSLIDLQSLNNNEPSPTQYNASLEDVIYRFDSDISKSNLNSFKPYYLVLHGVEISIFSDKTKQNLLSLHNLSGTFLSQGESLAKGKDMFYSLIIQHSKTLSIKFYFISQDKRDKWLKVMQKLIGYQNFSEHYEILNKTIGQGNFGVVKMGIHKQTNIKVAVKIITKSKLKPKEYELIRSELDIMKLFHHPKLVKLLDHFENNEYIYIVMEYLSGGDLNLLIKEQKELTESQVALIIKQIAEGLEYINNYGAIHRDIKMENIMLKVKGDLNSVTIIDFGLTKTIAPGEKLAETMGTLAFIAPEVISRNPYDKAVDVWSIGVVFYYLLSGKLPFYAETEENVTKKIKYSNPDYNEKVIGKRSEACIEMVKKCLEKKPEKRISIRNLLQSDWIKKQSKV